MKALNYTNAALTSLKMLFRMPGNAYLLDHKIIRDLMSKMQSAEKFVLPNKGELLFEESEFSPGLEVGRLPFPETLIEFPFDESLQGVQSGEAASTRRIALGIEGHVSIIPNEFSTFTPYFEKPDVQPNGYIVVVLSYFDYIRSWQPCYIAPAVLFGDKTMKVERGDHSPTSVQIPHTACLFLPTVARENGCSITSTDYIRELRVMFELTLALSCANVSSEKLAPSKAKKLLGKGKPLKDHEYRILTLDGTRAAPSGGFINNPASDGEAKVRTHLRRGHIRRLDGGTRQIWVNQCVVAPHSKLGMIEKEYDMRGFRKAS